jgi:hypothetical protein
MSKQDKTAVAPASMASELLLELVSNDLSLPHNLRAAFLNDLASGKPVELNHLRIALFAKDQACEHEAGPPPS